MTTTDLLSIWITETNGYDVDRFRPDGAQLQAWLDTYGETVAAIGIREGTRGFMWKMGGVASPEQAYYMINYINVTMKNTQHELAQSEADSASQGKEGS